MKPIIEKLKRIDGYPKTLEDYAIKTYSGGAVTLLSYLLILYLCTMELQAYLTPDTIEELFVDTTRIPKLQINLNVSVPHIPCKYLSLDAMDTSGEQHLQIEHSIFKTSIDPLGNPIAEPTKEDLTTALQAAYNNNNSNDKNETSKDVAVTKCGSCYGAESDELNITCCNTCADVRDAYMKRKWNFPDPEAIDQCKNLGTGFDKLPDEGCKIHGFMEVNRVGGSFHIAPGRSFSVSHVHVHDVQPYSSTTFNTSHIIEHLSFGKNIPGLTDPLDGTWGVTNEGATMFQYYIKIVPTIYSQETKKSLKETTITNQFSVTRHQKKDGEGGMPGVFFTYELAPFMVKYTKKFRTFGQFATNVCAMIGGVFTVAGFLDSFLYYGLNAVKQKIEIGKIN